MMWASSATREVAAGNCCSVRGRSFLKCTCGSKKIHKPYTVTAARTKRAVRLRRVGGEFSGARGLEGPGTGGFRSINGIAHLAGGVFAGTTRRKTQIFAHLMYGCVEVARVIRGRRKPTKKGRRRSRFHLTLRSLGRSNTTLHPHETSNQSLFYVHFLSSE